MFLAAKNAKNTEKEEKILHHLHFYTAKGYGGEGFCPQGEEGGGGGDGGI